ncbi:MAG: hypothetical protein E7490_08425 [Ruminococcaceae bacterium]|nr:hypothetical protein [Oscillospiraceae bacterium]
MKNKIKLVSLILSLLTLFGCAEKPLQSSGESSVTNSEVSSTDVASLVSEDEESATVNENKEQFLKAPEGADGFVYDRETFRFTTKDEMEVRGGMMDPHTPYVKEYDEYIQYYKENNYIYVKVSIAGESFSVINSKMGNTCLFSNEKNMDGVFTPVLIEEVVDSLGNKVTVSKGDIVYVHEWYSKVSEKLIKLWEDTLAQDKENYIENEYNDFEVREKIIDYSKAHTNDNSIKLYYAYPMEQGKSYLVLIKNEKLTNSLDMDMYDTWPYVLNLGDSAPDSYKDTDFFLYFYYQYEILWKACKDLYGSYFD